MTSPANEDLSKTLLTQGRDGGDQHPEDQILSADHEDIALILAGIEEATNGAAKVGRPGAAQPDSPQQFLARIKRWEAKHIRENPSNHNEITVAFANQFGAWADPAPWCAETVTIIGNEGSVLPAGCASAGAWDLTDRLHNAGFGRTLDTLHFPGVISFNYGSGHIGFILGLTIDHQYAYTFEGNTGSGNSGNDGDGAYFRKRFLGGGAVHAVADLHFGNAAPVDPSPFLGLTDPLTTSLAVKNVQHALNVAGNHLTEDGVYGQTTADTVNLFNKNHKINDPKTGQPQHGVSKDTWKALRALVHG
jgi:hypothetical protein